MLGNRPGRGSDFLQLDPAAAPPRRLSEWLAGALRAAIAEGRAPVGTRLPPTRELADDLGLSRGVVLEAYRRLADEALVVGRPKVGTVVVGPPTAPAAALSDPAPPDGAGIDRTPLLPRRTDSVAAGTINLSPGLPDLASFPPGVWLRAERAVLSELARSTLGYGDPQGHPQLRAELAGWLGRTRGVHLGADDVIVVDGVAQALALLARVLRDRGHTRVAVEDPGSRGARDQLGYWGLAAVPVPVDGAGLQAQLLPDVDADAVLLTPAHEFPTGVVLAPERRRSVLEWAAAGSSRPRVVIEDDYDAEFRYDRAPVPAMQASAPHLVAYTGSVSKTLAPGLRLGWLVAPRHLRAVLVEAKHHSDLGSPVLPQLVLARLLATGEYERHGRRVRLRHRERRDAVRSALAELAPQVQVHGVAAGLHLLVTFPPDVTAHAVDDERLAADLLAAGVVVHPLSWHRLSPGQPGLVIGYASSTPTQLRDAVQRMAAVIARPSR